MNQRPARISGWVQISGRRVKPGMPPEVGGLVDVSKTGARLYLSWKVGVGETLPMALKLPETSTVIHTPGKVVWVKRDAPGNMENFEARLRLLKDLVHGGHSKGGMMYGYAAGIRWDPGVPRECIRAIQRHFEEENPRPVKRVFLNLKPDLDSDATPASLRSKD